MPRDEWNRPNVVRDGYEQQRERERLERQGIPPGAHPPKRRKGKPHGIQHWRAQQQALEEQLVGTARARGICLVVKHHGRNGRQRHWMFNDTKGKRLLDYWPYTGTVWRKEDAYRGKVETPQEALDLAETILSKGSSGKARPGAPLPSQNRNDMIPTAFASEPTVALLLEKVAAMQAVLLEARGILLDRRKVWTEGFLNRLLELAEWDGELP